MWEPNEKVINEYELSLKELRKAKSKRADIKEKFKELDQLDDWTNEMAVELKLISEMVSNMEYSLYWMKNGLERQSVRGVTNKSYIQRTDYWGDISIASKHQNITDQYFFDETESDIEEDDAKIERYISCLSKREREAFIYIVVEGHTYEKTAEFMGITRGAVQMMLSRGKTKIKKLISAESEAKNTELIES